MNILKLLVWDIKDRFVHTCTSMAGCVLLLSALQLQDSMSSYGYVYFDLLTYLAELTTI